MNACFEENSQIDYSNLEDCCIFLKNIQKLCGANLFLIRVPYFKRDWQVAFRKELGMYYFSDEDHKIEHTLEELKQELKDLINEVLDEREHERKLNGPYDFPEED